MTPKEIIDAEKWLTNEAAAGNRFAKIIRERMDDLRGALEKEKLKAVAQPAPQVELFSS